MGDAADRVRDRLRDGLVERLPGYRWTTEEAVGRTPVDVVGVAADPETGAGQAVVLVELEWRRADPANNPVKLFRHAAEGRLADLVEDDTSTADGDVDRAPDALCVQVFTEYYRTSDGDSSKRENAEFAGRRLARVVDGLEYEGASLSLAPPKRGGELPSGWRETVDEATDRIAWRVRS